MSYILEALKKADKKRKLGETPDLHTVHESGLENPDQRSGWLLALALALLANAALITWWLKPWSPEQNLPAQVVAEVPVVEQTEALEQASPAISEDQDGDEPVVAEVDDPEDLIAPVELTENTIPTQQEVAQAPTGGPPIPAPLATAGDPAATMTEPGGPATELIPVPSMPPVVAQGESSGPSVLPPQVARTTIPALPPMPEVTGSADSEDLMDIDDDSGEAALQPFEDAPPTALAESMAGRLINAGDREGFDEQEVIDMPEELFDIAKIPYAYQLPASIQQHLPEIKISFHRFTHTVSGRMASINGRIMRQGQDLNSDLKVDRIVESGVVLLIKEQDKLFKIDIE